MLQYIAPYNMIGLGDIRDEDRKFHFSTNYFDFSSSDIDVLVRHKKKLQCMPLKDVGQGMYVYVISRASILGTELLDTTYAMLAYKQYVTFDEETGIKKYFLWKKSIDFMSYCNDIIAGYLSDTDLSISSLSNFIYVQTNSVGDFYDMQEDTTYIKLLSYLFMTSLLYGKWQIQGSILFSIKIQVGFFGDAHTYKNILCDSIKNMKYIGLFMTLSEQRTNGIDILQITITDPTILALFVSWNKQKKTKNDSYDMNILSIAQENVHKQHYDAICDFLQSKNLENNIASIKQSSIKICKRV